MLCLTFIMPTDSTSQSIYFSSGVDEDFQPVGLDEAFYMGTNPDYLYIFLDFGYEQSKGNIELRIFKSNGGRNGNYTFQNSEYLNFEKGWTWAGKKVTFQSSGYYRIDAYNALGYKLTSKILTLYDPR